jgi:hypothetical protein
MRNLINPFLLAVTMVLALIGCTSTPVPATEVDARPNITTPMPAAAMDELTAATPTPTTVEPAINSRFTIKSAICSDQQGPDCTTLRLGDDFLTTSLPGRGYLYSCSGANPNAPGARESKITWIDFAAKTWNFFEKLWLPASANDAAVGTYAETTIGDQRLISVNNLPVDGLIGDWPMTNYAELTAIDGNPGPRPHRQVAWGWARSALQLTESFSTTLPTVAVKTL